MPTLQQLPQAGTTDASDRLLIGRQDEVCTISVETLLDSVQPKLTIASGTLLGRVSILPGGPEPVQLGLGLAIRDGVLSLDTSRMAPIESPDFAGVPMAPTQLPDDISRALATTEYVQAQLVGRTTIALGARLPKIDASDAEVAIDGGVPRSLRARAAEVFNVRDFGAKGDVVRLVAGTTISAGSTMLQVVGASFGLKDVGKRIVVHGAGNEAAPLTNLITSVVDETHVALASPAKTSVAGLMRSICYGSDDTSAIASAIAAAGMNGGKVCFSPGRYGVSATVWLPESGCIQVAGSGHGCTELIAMSPLAGAVMSKGTIPHRGSQIVDIRIDANGLATYALDLQCAEGYRVDGCELANGTSAGLRIGDGVHDARRTQVTGSRICNDYAVFGTAASLPTYNVLVNGSASCLSGVVFAKARVANVRDCGCGDGVYVATRAFGVEEGPGEREAQYGYWLNGSAMLLGCEVEGVRAVANASSAGGVHGAGIRIDGANVQVIGARIKGLANGAAGVLLTADSTGSGPANCYIAGNIVEIGSISAADAIVQQGAPSPTTIICHNPGAALQQGIAGVVTSGVKVVVPAVSGTTSYQATYLDPRTFAISQPLEGELVIVLPPSPNVGARYRCVRTPSSGGMGIVRIHATGSAADGSGNVAVLPNAGSFVDVEWDNGVWQVTSQGWLDGTRLSLSGNLEVAGTTSLRTATAVTPASGDASSTVATTAFVKAQNYLQAEANLSDLSAPASARVALGLGSMALQGQNAVAISGGIVDGTTVGRTVPSTGNFTTLSATKVVLTGGSGVTEAGGYVNLQCANGLAAQLYVAPGMSGFLVSSATNTSVTLAPGQPNADLVLRGSGTGTARAPSGLAVNGGTLTANVVGIAGGTIDGVTLGATLGIGPIKGVAKAQLFEASWEAGLFSAAGGAGLNDTLTLVNTSNAHLALWTPNKNVGWGLNADTTTGNLRLVRNAGTGSIVLGNATPVVVGGDLSVSGALTLGASSSRLGFYGVAGSQRPTVTGSRGGSAAMASLLAALAGLGLLTDSSTA